jgi:succinate dehydrogenase / fumarate reductase membrane anchor subunit
MSLRSPLGRVLGHGSAKSGADHWHAQRVSAIALALLGLWFVVSLLALGGTSHGSVSAWLRSPVQAALAVLLVLTAAYHAALGLQVVVEDYVADKGARFALLVAVRFALVVAAAVGVLAVARVALGGAA